MKRLLVLLELLQRHRANEFCHVGDGVERVLKEDPIVPRHRSSPGLAEHGRSPSVDFFKYR